jgi:hypothetical protein
VVARILSSVGDDRAHKLLDQFERGPMRRKRTPAGDRLCLSQTTADLAVNLEDDVTSRWISVREADSGRELRVRLKLLRGGFLGSVEIHGSPSPGWCLDESIPVNVDGALALDPVVYLEQTTVEAILGPLTTFDRAVASVGARGRDPQALPVDLRALWDVASLVVSQSVEIWGPRDAYLADEDHLVIGQAVAGSAGIGVHLTDKVYEFAEFGRGETRAYLRLGDLLRAE